MLIHEGNTMFHEKPGWLNTTINLLIGALIALGLCFLFL